MTHDVVIVGGGPTGLSAALALGRARRSVLVCDAGPRRNAAATHIHNFVTRDGTPPDAFRAAAHAELARYPGVAIREDVVESIDGEKGAFVVGVGGGAVTARRILLATGMIDELPAIEGFREHWGTSIFQCPYCHAWEVQDRPFAVLLATPELVDFAIFLRAWTRDVVALTNGAFTLHADAMQRLRQAGVRVEERPLRRLVGQQGALRHIEVDGGEAIVAEVLFAKPPQRQVPLVASLGLATTASGHLEISDPHRETSRSGIHAAGDLTTPMQSAITGAAAGTLAAGMINHAVVIERALAGGLG